MSKLYDTLHTGNSQSPRRKGTRGSSDGMPDLFEFFAARKAAEEARAAQTQTSSAPGPAPEPPPEPALVKIPVPVEETPAPEENIPVEAAGAEPEVESGPPPPPEPPAELPEEPPAKVDADIGVDPRRTTARSLYAPGTRVAPTIKPQQPSIQSKILLLVAPLVVAALLIGAYIGLKKVRQSIEEAQDLETSAPMAEPLPPEGMEESELLQQPSAPPDQFIQVPGTIVRREGNTFVVIFEQGIFSRADQLSREAENILKELGRQLAALNNMESIMVIGCTDNVPIKPTSQFKNNRVLGMQRALAVVKFLRAQTALPGNLFQVLSPGDQAAPYPNDTAANRAKNKTVVIQVTLSSP